MKKNYYVIMILMLFNSIFAQDSHYWNLQYGTKSTLLGGVVIGSVTDLSATYYNPGAVALFNDAKAILSAKVYQYETITIVNGAGENKDLDYSSITPSPTFIAFDVNIDTTGINKLAFSLLTRQSMNFDFETRQISTINNSTNSDFDYTAGGVSANQKLDEIWGGVTFSHKFTETIGMGVTAYIAYRNQTLDFQTIVEGLDANDQITSIMAIRKLNYNNYRALLKFGGGINLNPVTLGLTVTTPSLNLLGSGSYGYHNFINNPANPLENVFESNYQDDLKSKYNTSWAIGFGAGYWGKQIRLHFSAEWFNAVHQYEPLTLDPLFSQSTNQYFTKNITQQLKSVLNAGIGVDYKLNEKWSFAGSFITDFSANDTNAETNLSLSKWDIYHISAGSNFKLASSEITLGLSYSFGNDVIKQVANIGDPENGTNENIETASDVKFQRIKVLFGFLF